MGEPFLGEVDDVLCRAATAFGGGVGGTHEELCGLLSGGVLLVGARCGRLRADEDSESCRALAARCRANFLAAFGATRCQDLRDMGYGSEGMPCSALAAQAARVLLKTLDASC
ncbi:MAG: C_GCAxxG_C_C family protein [Anaerolineae bacterium]|nr:C_GCAxxG_C_C family protein [Anaerolineae bacterium]